MKKANVKTKTIIWLILLIIAIIVLCLTSVVIVNAEYIIDANLNYVQLGSDVVLDAQVERSYAIGAVALSIVVILMGSYICYSGFKSWKYNAVL
ncbi:hypothetical protein MM26B8_01400 [Mycoplasmopsis meleagridis]|uniref:Uncharacterized protein n=1 Tax=Mycoplasmopsis meleagridis ATCC 25294 TaxID=1264554 RepID=A0A0F5H0S5_9BACT|nr:hypothetical protein [Mycoplasmopsis meleagridis]KKB26926.1 hypothetical protein MMELEA_03760 [Mycoplasmopsis meleagridis ATCC 25294]KUH47467.1 hypothetical protein ASB56_01205 [Mycoplasmopsis meleagridis]OAD18515.1 hypothetical protein MM26B8_01400 [Mycoplasmopsis meleagridis]VEU77616.1 Uncharacterised protein [Mycoplasmopsis meleagridis]